MKWFLFICFAALCGAQGSCAQRCSLLGWGRVKHCAEHISLCETSKRVEGCCYKNLSVAEAISDSECSCDRFCGALEDCCSDFCAECGPGSSLEQELSSRRLLQTTSRPTRSPTARPTRRPTGEPTRKPTRYPTYTPTKKPTKFPTNKPTKRPTGEPTTPTSKPTRYPTHTPTKKPTKFPTNKPTKRPTGEPTTPTSKPTRYPTHTPTKKPTKFPTNKPTKRPTQEPTLRPSRIPTLAPSRRPTKFPTQKPTRRPTNQPTTKPTRFPTVQPTRKPTKAPTSKPTKRPTGIPTTKPTRFPTQFPSRKPTRFPTQKPTGPTTPAPTTPMPTTRAPTQAPTLTKPCELYDSSCELCTAHLRDPADPASTCFWVRTAPPLLNDKTTGALKPAELQDRSWARCCSRPDCGLRRTVYVGASKTPKAVWPLVTQDPRDCGCSYINSKLYPYDSYYAYLNKTGNATSLCLACNGQYDNPPPPPTPRPTIQFEFVTDTPTRSPTPTSFRSSMCVWTSQGCKVAATRDAAARIVNCSSLPE